MSQLSTVEPSSADSRSTLESDSLFALPARCCDISRYKSLLLIDVTGTVLYSSAENLRPVQSSPGISKYAELQKF